MGPSPSETAPAAAPAPEQPELLPDTWQETLVADEQQPPETWPPAPVPETPEQPPETSPPAPVPETLVADEQQPATIAETPEQPPETSPPAP
eukprot:4935781-Heterocapsa_arctica.AAC.1